MLQPHRQQHQQPPLLLQPLPRVLSLQRQVQRPHLLPQPKNPNFSLKSSG
jgi:hypothetical protein